MNFSETTFVMEERSGEARVRIFTKDRELPFAGHPTLGTAWVLGRDRDCYTLELAAGHVPVTFEDGIAWMEPPAISMGDVVDRPRAAALLGLDEIEIDRPLPVPVRHDRPLVPARRRADAGCPAAGGY